MQDPEDNVTDIDDVPDLRKRVETFRDLLTLQTALIRLDAPDGCGLNRQGRRATRRDLVKRYKAACREHGLDADVFLKRASRGAK
jgi:hypothetical protein